MQGYIKDNKLIINSMIQDNEKEELLDFIEEVEEKGVETITLYDIKGEKSGIAFKIKEEE